MSSFKRTWGIPLVLCVVVAMALVSAAIAPRSASAATAPAPAVSLSTTLVAVGSPVTISASGFSAGASVTVAISGQTAPLATLKAGSTGSVAPTAMTIPSSLGAGMYTLTLTGSISHHVASVPITLMSASPATFRPLFPTVPHAGAVTFGGHNWAPGESITVSVNGIAGTVATLHADGAGNIQEIAVRMPASIPGGTYTLTAIGAASKRTATSTLTFQPGPAPVPVTPTTTNRGGLIMVSGSQFAPGEQVTVTLAGLTTPLATLTANAQGQVPSTGISIPYAAGLGTHTLTLTGSRSKHTVSATIDIVALTPSIAVSMATVSPGNTVTVTGKGFGRQEQITLSLNGAALPTSPSVITTTNGAFTATVTVPASLLSGANAISAIGNESRVSAVQTMTGVLPVAATLYFAGATTMPGDTANMAIENPNAQPAHLTMTFYYASGAPGQATMTVPANSRATADLGMMAGANRVFGVKLDADRKISAELRVLRSGKDGYGMLGVTAPNTTWYLAEGYTGVTFHETLSLVNPGSTASQVTLRLLPFGGRAARTVTVGVAPNSEQSVDVNSLMPNQSLSVIAHASQPIVLARKLTFSTNGYGITAKPGISTPATSWIFAEGTTTTRFQTFLTILNPNTAGTFITASFYGQTGGSLGSRTVYVAPKSRANMKLNDFLNASGIATVISSNLPVVVERPEYFGNPNGMDVAGSDVFGRNGAGLSWSFPAGDTLSHNEYLLIYNPSPTDVTITADFYTADGRVISKQIAVPPTVRYNVDVNTLVPNLAKEHSVTLRSTNGQGFIAEQTIFAPDYSSLTSTQGSAS